MDVRKPFSLPVVVQWLSCVWICATPRTAAPPGSPVLHYHPKITQTHVHWVDDAIQASHPLSPPTPPALNLSQHQGLFQWVSSLLSGSQNIGASVSISPSNEYSGLISFRVDWFDLAIQGILKRLPQHHSLKTLVLQCSAFFILQLSHSYMTTGQTIALKRWTFVGKKCLCFLICCLGAP